MTIINTLRCNGEGCTAQKKETNHWWGGKVTKDNKIIIEPVIMKSSQFHFCGIDCAVKWVAKRMQVITQLPVKVDTEVPK